MPVGLKISTNVDGLNKLKEYIEYLHKMNSMQNDKNFQKYIQRKCLETVMKVTDERLIGGTTDDEYIEEYKRNHKIRETSDGFILYNDTTIPQSLLPVTEKTAENYPNGFSIAMAFEYGIGIVGENDAKVGAWDYNVNNWNFAWRYKKDGVLYSTYGYSGFEIYRYTAEEIEKQLPKWVLNYKGKDGGVSQ